MRNPGVRFQIDVYAIEHDPFAIRRRHGCADTLQFHHVFECEKMLLRWRLREHRVGEQKKCCEKTFHKQAKLPFNADRRKQRSGERTPPACWRSHSATANFCRPSFIAQEFRVTQKFVAAECGDRHAESVRSPESGDWPRAGRALG
jgi:hypothetical protein